MRNLKIIIFILFIFTLFVIVSKQNTEARYFSSLEMKDTNEYHCILAESRGASSSYLFSNGCE